LGQRQHVTGGTDGNSLLEVPDVLQNLGAANLLIFIATTVPGSVNGTCKNLSF